MSGSKKVAADKRLVDGMLGQVDPVDCSMDAMLQRQSSPPVKKTPAGGKKRPAAKAAAAPKRATGKQAKKGRGGGKDKTDKPKLPELGWAGKPAPTSHFSGAAGYVRDRVVRLLKAHQGGAGPGAVAEANRTIDSLDSCEALEYAAVALDGLRIHEARFEAQVRRPFGSVIETLQQRAGLL